MTDRARGDKRIGGKGEKGFDGTGEWRSGPSPKCLVDGAFLGGYLERQWVTRM